MRLKSKHVVFSLNKESRIYGDKMQLCFCLLTLKYQTSMNVLNMITDKFVLLLVINPNVRTSGYIGDIWNTHVCLKGDKIM